MKEVGRKWRVRQVWLLGAGLVALPLAIKQTHPPPAPLFGPETRVALAPFASPDLVRVSNASNGRSILSANVLGDLNVDGLVDDADFAAFSNAYDTLICS